MSKLRKFALTGIVLTFAGLIYVFFGLLPAKVKAIDSRMNAVIPHTKYAISERAQTLHDSLLVGDLHSDMLLWMRDPRRRHDYGHMDLPRLQAGNIGLQVFASVTKTPSGLNYEENDASSDDITKLAIAQRWPIRSWTSLRQRAVYHARRLHALERQTDGALQVIKSRESLAAFLSARSGGSRNIGGILATEGAHPLEGRLQNVDTLYREGYRMLGLQHFFDNELGGSLHGRSGAGLTDFGKDVVARMDELDMMIDVAHSSPAVVRDVLSMTDQPLIVSHTGVYSHCASARNIPDELMHRITAGGGLIGIGFWADVTCDASPKGVAGAALYAAQLFGVEHVALGSDFDGTVLTSMDASELSALTQALLDQGASEADIRLIMGGNMARFFLENLPSDPEFKPRGD